MRRSKRLVLDRGRRDDAAGHVDDDRARPAGPHVEPEKIHLINFSPLKRLLLGARAPSPAMSAKRERSSPLRTVHDLNVLLTRRRARAPALPVLTCFVSRHLTFFLLFCRLHL